MSVMQDRNLRLATAALSRSGVVARVHAQFAADDAPNMTALARVVIDYLAAEQQRSRIARDADIEAGAWIFVWALHEALLGHTRRPGRSIGIERVVDTLLNGLGGPRTG